jgi:hypothetical protein
MGEMRNTYKILVGKPERKTPLGRSRRRLKDNIRMDLRKIRWEVVDWMYLAHDLWRDLVNLASSQDICRFLENLQVHCRIHESPSEAMCNIS